VDKISGDKPRFCAELIHLIAALFGLQEVGAELKQSIPRGRSFEINRVGRLKLTDRDEIDIPAIHPVSYSNTFGTGRRF
jgi:hypothetical protein